MYFGTIAAFCALVSLYMVVVNMTRPSIPKELGSAVHKAWPKNRTRDTKVYVQPNIKTAIHEPKHVCNDPDAKNNSLLLLFVVTSAVPHFYLRDRARRSWITNSGYNLRLRKQLEEDSDDDDMIEGKQYMQFADYDDVNYEAVFILGLPSGPNSTKEQEMINNEADRYGDILQENFIDNYYNLSIKSTMMLKWVTRKCGHSVRYILKTDDDVYINAIPLLQMFRYRAQIFDEMRNSTGNNTAEYELRGHLSCTTRPRTHPGSRWYSPHYLYSKPHYPCFVFGVGYLFSIPTAHALYEAALRTPIFHLEDVYITGLCRENAQPKIEAVEDRPLSSTVEEKSNTFQHYEKTSHKFLDWKIRNPFSSRLKKKTLSLKKPSLGNVTDLILPDISE